MAGTGSSSWPRYLLETRIKGALVGENQVPANVVQPYVVGVDDAVGGAAGVFAALIQAQKLQIGAPLLRKLVFLAGHFLGDIDLQSLGVEAAAGGEPRGNAVDVFPL